MRYADTPHFDESQHPRATTGKFATKPHSDAEVALSPMGVSVTGTFAREYPVIVESTHRDTGERIIRRFGPTDADPEKSMQLEADAFGDNYPDEDLDEVAYDENGGTAPSVWETESGSLYRPDRGLTAQIQLERWVGDDVQTDETIEFPVQHILDRCDLDDLTNKEEQDVDSDDFIIDGLQQDGLLDHVGPSTVYIPDGFEAYLAYRRGTGREIGIDAAPPQKFVEQALSNLDAQQKMLDERRARLLGV